MTAADETDGGASPRLFLLGLVVFLGSCLLFVADLVRGVDIYRSVAGNASGAVLLIGWAALDTLADPDSEVETVGGAAGTALLLYGLYLLLAGIGISLTGVFLHDRLTVGLLYLPLGALIVLLGYAIFPKDAVNKSGDGGPEQEPSTGDSSVTGET